MDKLKNLNILQWNARSANANKLNLINSLKANNIHIAMLSETCFYPNKAYNFSGYNIVRSDRGSGKGGVAILVATQIQFRSISFSNFNISKLIEVCGIEISINKEQITIISLYKSPKKVISLDDWECFLSKLTGNTIIGGDFNAHHSLWGSGKTDTDGKVLAGALNNVNLIVINDGSATRLTPPGITKSVVDITLVSPSLASVTEWKILDDCMGSDHFPIIIKVNEAICENTVYPSRKWCSKKANWDIFQNFLDSYIINLPHGENIHEKITIFVDAIDKSCKMSMPLNKPFLPSHPKKAIWWDNECEEAQSQKIKALKLYKLHSSLDNFVSYKRYEAKAKKLYKMKSKEAWAKFCSTLSSTTPINEIWNTVKRLKSYSPHRDISDNIVDAVLNKLAPPSVNKQNNKETATDNTNNPLLRKFSLSELEFSIKLSRDTSPGVDQITYTMLSHLGPLAKKLLLDIFNLIWLNGDVPTLMKQCIVILILKHGKDPMDYNSYRAITLLSCVTKTFERMIKVRLECWIKSNNILPSNQYGFKRGYGTNDALVHFVTDIQLGLSENLTTGAVFVDIKSAYDNVNLDILRQKMLSLKMPFQIAHLICNLYSNRGIYIRKNRKELIGPRYTSQGIPQGSVLSPLLFNLYTLDIHQLFSPTITCIQYADDLVVFSSRRTYKENKKDLRHIMYIINMWTFSNGFTISYDKCAIVLFARKKPPDFTFIKCCSNEIPVLASYKYLGVHLDRKLLWGMHIDYTVKRCEKGVNLLKMICKGLRGADQFVSLLFYKSYIRSIIDYGSILYGSGSYSRLTKLDRIQTKSLKIAVGLMKSTPNEATLVESLVPPLEIRRQILASNYVILQNSRCNNICKLISSIAVQNYVTPYFRKKNSPPLAQAFIACSESGLIRSYSTPLKELFDLEFSAVTSIPDTMIPKYIAHLPSAPIFLEALNNCTDYTAIYTDGSKSSENTTCAIYVPDYGVEQSYSLDPLSTIFSAEAVAIVQGLKWALQSSVSNIAICTDSLSVINALKNPRKQNHINIFVLEIMNLLDVLTANKIQVKFIWTKGHSNIQGNEKVDHIAKNFNEHTCLEIPQHNPGDLKRTARKKLMEKWQQRWQEYGIKSNTSYYRIHNKIPKHHWYKDVKASRCMIATVARLKTNHGRFPSHLHKIGVLRSPFCSCSDITGDLNHIFFDCTNNRSHTKWLLQELRNEGVEDPTCLPLILSSNKVRVYQSLMLFLKKINLSI